MSRTSWICGGRLRRYGSDASARGARPMSTRTLAHFDPAHEGIVQPHPAPRRHDTAQQPQPQPRAVAIDLVARPAGEREDERRHAEVVNAVHLDVEPAFAHSDDAKQAPAQVEVETVAERLRVGHRERVNRHEQLAEFRPFQGPKALFLLFDGVLRRRLEPRPDRQVVDLAVEQDRPAQGSEDRFPPRHAQRVRLPERADPEVPAQRLDDGTQRDQRAGRRTGPGQGRDVTADDDRPLLAGEDDRLRLVVFPRRRRRGRQEPQGHGQQSGNTPEDAASERHYGNLTPSPQDRIPTVRTRSGRIPGGRRRRGRSRPC